VLLTKFCRFKECLKTTNQLHKTLTRNDCPTLPSFKECLHEQAHALNSFQRPNHNPYSQTYNPGWRNHPNFSWKSDNNNAQTSQPSFEAHHNFQNSHGYAPSYVPPPRRNLEETLHAFIEKQETINTQLAQSMIDFKDTLAKFTSALSFHEKGRILLFPLLSSPHGPNKVVLSPSCNG